MARRYATLAGDPQDDFGAQLEGRAIAANRARQRRRRPQQLGVAPFVAAAGASVVNKIFGGSSHDYEADERAFADLALRGDYNTLLAAAQDTASFPTKSRKAAIARLRTAGVLDIRSPGAWLNLANSLALRATEYSHARNWLRALATNAGVVGPSGEYIGPGQLGNDGGTNVAQFAGQLLSGVAVDPSITATTPLNITPSTSSPSAAARFVTDVARSGLVDPAAAARIASGADSVRMAAGASQGATAGAQAGSAFGAVSTMPLAKVALGIVALLVAVPLLKRGR